jgi:septal ring factor EnvC (AmiA/AmiB activator)
LILIREKAMTRGNGKIWRLNRTVNPSVLVQLAFLASLIVGSWVNLQRQLDSLQRDVTSLLESQKRSADKVEALQEKVISHEFRLKHLEKGLQE